MTSAPVNEAVSIDDLTRDPYPIYRRFRAETPVVHVASVGRTMITKAADTRIVKDHWRLFRSDAPNTTIKRAHAVATQ